MLLYREQNGAIIHQEWVAETPIPADVLWIDMLTPTKEEEAAVEAFLGLEIPTHEEMREIELSSRLYQEGGAQYMTAMMLAKVDSEMPLTHAVTFILAGNRLVTLRYIDTTSFRRFAASLKKTPCGNDGAGVLLGLFDSIVNRMADILERLDREIDAVTKDIFRRAEPNVRSAPVDYHLLLQYIGRCGDLASKTHESLVTLGRAASYAGHHPQLSCAPYEAELGSIRRDITGLTDHGNYLTGKVNFLLDASLGMVNIQQNNVFRILTVASFIFMPPTLIAGVYGMNFKLMPELEWHWGYPLAVLLMLLSAILPIALLRQRRML